MAASHDGESVEEQSDETDETITSRQIFILTFLKPRDYRVVFGGQEKTSSYDEVFVELVTGIGPVTSSLPMTCSTD